MKYIIALAALTLTACGSGSSAKAPAVSGDVSQLKHVLFISDQSSGIWNANIWSGFDGTYVTTKYVTGFVDYAALDGTALVGAAEQLPTWLSEDDYDAVVFSIGAYENAHDVITSPFYFHNYGYVHESHAANFINALRSTAGAPSKLIFIQPDQNGGSAYLQNNAATLGLTVIDDAFASGNATPQIFASIVTKLRLALGQLP